MSTTESTTIVTNEIATRPADAREIMRAISPGVLMSCGARDAVALPDGVQMTVGRGRMTKLVIKLQACDLFTVERVRLRRSDWVPVSVAVTQDVHVENLDRVVLDLGDR